MLLFTGSTLANPGGTPGGTPGGLLPCAHVAECPLKTKSLEKADRLALILLLEGPEQHSFISGTGGYYLPVRAKCHAAKLI